MSSGNSAFFAGFKSLNQLISNHAPSSYEYDNNGWDDNFTTVLPSRSLARHRHSHRKHSGAGFFIGRLRTPNITKYVLQNDPTVPSERAAQVGVAPFDPLRDATVIAQGGFNVPNQHGSQYFEIGWKEKGEPSQVLEFNRFRLKFGVLKIVNQSRNYRKMRLNAGNALDVEADMMIKDKQAWSNWYKLRWYDSSWAVPLTPLEEGQQIVESKLERLKHLASSPLILMREYLNKEILPVFPVGSEEYLLLFYTHDKFPYFFPTGMFSTRMFGRYELKVRIYSTEIHPKIWHYELEIKSWNNFTLKELSHND